MLENQGEFIIIQVVLRQCVAALMIPVFTSLLSVISHASNLLCVYES